MGKRAWLAVKDQPHYRADAFRAGLRRLGYEVVPIIRGTIEPDDLLVTWNLHGEAEQRAGLFRAAGAKVIVAENGYIGKDKDGRQLYALARDAHNGAGRWPQENDAGMRWMRQWAEGIVDDIATEGKLIAALGRNPSVVLVAAQRGIGSRQMRSPDGWHKQVAAQLQARRMTCWVREHPGALFGAAKNQTPLYRHLAAARCVVVWSSSVGVRALLHGIPVVYCAPQWICADAAGWGIAAVEGATHNYDATLKAMHRLAWAQWSIAEIESGEPFARLVAL